MIYTSYFAKVRKMPANIYPISIAAQAPAWWKGFCYKALAPHWDILKNYKVTGNEKEYTKRFYAEILNKLNVNKVMEDLYMFVPKQSDCHVALCCYEVPNKFCHRHLVADWLNKQGIECKEYDGHNT